MTHPYSAPGLVKDLDARLELLEVWNQTVAQAWTDGSEDFLKEMDSLAQISAAPIAGLTTPVLWSPVPRQALACLGRSRARQLCDAPYLAGAPAASLQSGREWHNEYCEYRVIMRRHGGAWRPKRVEFTTELREYWEMVAVEDPPLLLDLAQTVLDDQTVTFEDLYGLPEPVAASPDERRAHFQQQTAGSAVKSSRIIPQGPLNRRRALFMCHPINGLDDLAYITTLGAQPYFRSTDGARSPAPLPWLYLDNPLLRHEPDAMVSLRDTYCRHADPAASAAAYQVAYAGGKIAFADPPGVYLREEDFDLAALSYQGQPLDPGWVRWSRPETGPRHQRLVLGPPDEAEDVFLDDIQVCRGAEPTPLLGGYQVLELLSVGPDLTVQLPPTASTAPARADLQVQPLLESIPCGSPGSSVYRDLQTWSALLHEGPQKPATALTYRHRSSHHQPDTTSGRR